MGAKLYSAAHLAKIKEIINKTRNNVFCQNKGQVMNRQTKPKKAYCFIKGILKYKLKMYLTLQILSNVRILTFC